MEQQFWHDKWDQGITGFHLSEVNPLLARYWPKLALEHRDVFVPLCGKSLDMAYLSELGHRVVGCELSAIAVNDFFSAFNQRVQAVREEAQYAYRTDAFTIFQGDFFQLKAAQVKQCQAFYDRAALIALPAAMRIDYVAQLTQLLPSHAEGLLVTLNYSHPTEQHTFGPPFAVSEVEVQQLYHPHFEIIQLDEQDVLQQNKKFLNRGVEWMTESVYHLKKR